MEKEKIRAKRQKQNAFKTPDPRLDKRNKSHAIEMNRKFSKALGKRHPQLSSIILERHARLAKGQPKPPLIINNRNKISTILNHTN